MLLLQLLPQSRHLLSCSISDLLLLLLSSFQVVTQRDYPGLQGANLCLQPLAGGDHVGNFTLLAVALALEGVPVGFEGGNLVGQEIFVFLAVVLVLFEIFLQLDELLPDLVLGLLDGVTLFFSLLDHDRLKAHGGPVFLEDLSGGVELDLQLHLAGSLCIPVLLDLVEHALLQVEIAAELVKDGLLLLQHDQDLLPTAALSVTFLFDGNLLPVNDSKARGAVFELPPQLGFALPQGFPLGFKLLDLVHQAALHLLLVPLELARVPELGRLGSEREDLDLLDRPAPTLDHGPVRVGGGHPRLGARSRLDLAGRRGGTDDTLGANDAGGEADRECRPCVGLGGRHVAGTGIRGR